MSTKSETGRGPADACREDTAPDQHWVNVQRQGDDDLDTSPLPNPHEFVQEKQCPPTPRESQSSIQKVCALTNPHESVREKQCPPTPRESQSSIQRVSQVRAKNVIIFGASGSGKSSVINAIAEKDLSMTSSDAAGCTFDSQCYSLDIFGQQFALFDTAGLDEASGGAVPQAVAEGNLKNLLHKLMSSPSAGIGLLVYCVRGTRVTRTLARNYNIFYSAICRKKVPIVIVVTGLENKTPAMESWWETNEKQLKKHDMHFKGHACVTTLRKSPASSDVFDSRITQSRETLRNLIVENYSEWTVDSGWTELALAGVRSINSYKTPSLPNVIICDPSQRDVEVADCITGTMRTCVIRIDEMEYQIHHISPPPEPDNKSTSSTEGKPEADLLIYYVCASEQAARQKFKTFCAAYRGNIVPFIIVVKGLNDREAANQWVQDHVAEDGAGNLISTFVPAENLNDTSARKEAMHELRELIPRYCLPRSGGRGGIFKNVARLLGKWV